MRDLRLITILHGGTLSDEHHRLLTGWAFDCAQHVLQIYEDVRPEDKRSHHAIELGRTWIRGEVLMREAHQEAFAANAAGRQMPDPVKFAARSVGQGVTVVHIVAPDLGAAAYAIRAAGACVAATHAERARAAQRVCRREQLLAGVHELVLEDQRNRSASCWNIFEDEALGRGEMRATLRPDPPAC